jgi:acyl-CoA thioesterase
MLTWNIFTFLIIGSGKALCTGRVWRQDGVLAVSMAQEGVVRSAL